jgi:hypothetical protein
MRQPSGRLARYIQEKSTLLELESRVSFRSPWAMTLASALALYFPGAGAFACVGRLQPTLPRATSDARRGVNPEVECRR